MLLHALEHLQICQVKASGGVRTLKDCIAMMKAGASRIGTSSGVVLMEEGKAAVIRGDTFEDEED